MNSADCIITIQNASKSNRGERAQMLEWLSNMADLIKCEGWSGRGKFRFNDLVLVLTVQHNKNVLPKEEQDRIERRLSKWIEYQICAFQYQGNILPPVFRACLYDVIPK